jgi:predicted CoA-binding protein
MSHQPRVAPLIEALLRRVRVIAIVGASPSPTRHSQTVARYLKEAAYDVVPIRPDGAEVAGLPSLRRLADVPGPVELAVLFRRPAALLVHVEEAAHKGVGAVWFPPGAVDAEAARHARSLGLVVVEGRCILEDHRHYLAHESGTPRRVTAHPARGHAGRRAREARRERAHGNAPRGGGGHGGGGGVRALLTEKKEAPPGPSSRRHSRRRGG